MADELDREAFLRAVERVLDRLESSAEELSRLDAAMGDGDMGVTITLGCRAVRKALPEMGQQDLGTVVAKCAMAFNGAAPSTLGALFAVGGMRAGKEARGTTSVDLPLLTRMVRAAEAGIQERGGAKRGDKTLLDALGPAADALQDAEVKGATLREAVRSAAEAARAGAKATTEMAAKSGRGSWISERTVGHQDPGATAVTIMWEALAAP